MKQPVWSVSSSLVILVLMLLTHLASAQTEGDPLGSMHDTTLQPPIIMVTEGDSSNHSSSSTEDYHQAFTNETSSNNNTKPTVSNRVDNRSVQCPFKCDCDQDFKRVNCANASFFQVPLAIPPEVQYLNLQDNILTELTASSLDNLHNLRVLDLSLNQISTIAPAAFIQVPNLRVLNLYSNLLNQSTSLAATDSLQELVLLNVSHNRITDLDNFTQTSIRQFDLGYNRLQAMPDLHAFPSLETLYLEYNQITNLTKILAPTPEPYSVMNSSLNSSVVFHQKEAVEEEEFKTNLTVLVLKANRINHVDPGFFDVFQELEVLDLSTNKLISIENILQTKLNHLVSLDLGSNPVDHLPNGVFAACPNLLSLHLSHMSHLTHINSASFANLSQLTELHLDDSPALTYIHALAFSMLDNLHVLNLSSTSISSMHPEFFASLSKSIQSVDLHGIDLQCTCDTAWLQHSRYLNTSLVRPNNLTCSLNGLVFPFVDFPEWAMNCSAASISPAVHKLSYEIGSSAMFDCLVEGEPSPDVLWIASKFKHKFTHHPAFIDHSELQPSDPLFHQHHYWHGSHLYYHNIPLSDRIFVLKNGSLYIDYVTRTDAGQYKCVARNHLGNETVVIMVMLDYNIMLETKIWCLVIGLGSAISFFLLGLVAGMLRWLAHFCSAEEREKRRSIRELLATIQEYKTEKVDVLRAYKTAKLDKISQFKNHKIDKIRLYKQATVTSILAHMHTMREHYQGQMGKIKDNYTDQVSRLRDNYGNHINKIKDYRAEKVERLRDNYQGQALKIRDYGSSQMQRLREQYKVQQQHMLKLLELLDIGNCMSVIEAECMRTESMLFDPDITFDLDQPVHVPREFLSSPHHRHHHSDDSEYITAGSQSDVSSPSDSAPTHSSSGDKKGKQHHRSHSTTSDSSGTVIDHSILTANLSPEIVDMLRQDIDNNQRTHHHHHHHRRKKRKRHHSAQLHKSPRRDKSQDKGKDKDPDNTTETADKPNVPAKQRETTSPGQDSVSSHVVTDMAEYESARETSPDSPSDPTNAIKLDDCVVIMDGVNNKPESSESVV